MGERLFLIIQKIFFQKHNIRNIFFIVFIILSPIVLLKWRHIEYEKLLEMVNSDLFNVSGILAGFVFTGLGIISTSNSEMVQNLKATQNFKLIKNFYISSILSFVLVMFLYLLKPIILINPTIDILNIKYIFSIIYLLIILFVFIVACILFVFSLFILNKEFNQ